MNLRGQGMFDPQPRAASRRHRGRMSFTGLIKTIRSHKKIAAITTAVILATGITTAAYADTVTSVSYATATASPVVASSVKITSNVTSKITLQNEKASGGSTSATCYKGSTFKAIFKKHKSAKCVVITKNGQKFLNSAISASGKRVWFNDYVGSSDSKAGTKSATWYWSGGAWHKGNCWNTNKLQGYKPAAHSVSYYHLVQKITYTLTETLSSEGKVVVIATAKCVQGGASASSSAQAIAASKAVIYIKIVGSSTTDVKAKSKAAVKALAAKLQEQARVAAINKAKSTAKGSITITLSAQASANASCTESTPPPIKTTPPVTPPVTTPPVTTPPVTPPVTTPPVTPPVTTPPVTPPVTTPPVTPPVTTPPPPAKPIVMLHSKNDVDQSTIDPVTGNLDESTAQGSFTYTISGSDSASVQVTAKYGTIRGVSQTSVKGQGTVTFTYVAPSDGNIPQSGLVDTITVVLNDPAAGSATDSTPITVNKVASDSIPNS